MTSGRDEDEGSRQPDTPINLRENFNALALWSPTVKTDSNGHATVDIKLPDNLTRYRITAVSVDTGKRFGKSGIDDHGETAADGPAERSAVYELWRQDRAAGRGSEPDRQRHGGGCRCPGHERRSGAEAGVERRDA